MEHPYAFDCTIPENTCDNLEYYFQQKLTFDNIKPCLPDKINNLSFLIDKLKFTKK
jgi:hypothetical protein